CIEFTLAEATPGLTPGSHIEVALPLSDGPEILTICGSFCFLGCAISLAHLPRGFTTPNEGCRGGDPSATDGRPRPSFVHGRLVGASLPGRRAECPSWNRSCRCAGGRS